MSQSGDLTPEDFPFSGSGRHGAGQNPASSVSVAVLIGWAHSVNRDGVRQTDRLSQRLHGR